MSTRRRAATPALRVPSPHTKRVTDIIAALDDDTPYYTFEYFPPKTNDGLINLHARMARMLSELKPSCVHITWGAGGSTSKLSLDLAVMAQDELGVPAVLHLTCTNMERQMLDETLKMAKEKGIVNILALRGDPPRGEEYWIATDPQFQHGADLVRYIRKEYGHDFCIGVAGYPEGAPDTLDPTKEIAYLKDKMDAGAEFVVTQLFYDTDHFIRWADQCKSAGITLPIIPGIMPIQNYSSFRRLTKLCKAQIPTRVADELGPIQNDDRAVKSYGVQLSVRQIRQLMNTGIRCFHLCTLNLELSVRQILDGLEWVDDESGVTNGVNGASHPIAINGALASQSSEDREGAPSSVGTTISLRPEGTWSRLDGDHLAKNWDEFPNGRFGDARSPAYGNLDGYGASLNATPTEALRMWGQPTTDDDISTIFSAYLSGRISAIPWNEEPIMMETSALLPKLLKLNERGWWTVGSQPSVDGATSTDPISGFGPRGGWVYQKPFVEFFSNRRDVLDLEVRIARETEQRGCSLIKYFAANNRGDLKTNMGSEECNAVTWGVFNGKEIVTTTKIEKLSFLAWNQEAFDIWNEWKHLYAPSSPSRTLIETIIQERWLVSVVHHDYKDPNLLWDFLLSDD